MQNPNNLPKERRWINEVCPRCGSTNVVLEVYNHSKERYCLSCTRNV